MAKIVKANLPLVRSELPRSEALKMFADKDEKYKVELINDLPEDAVISTYTQGISQTYAPGRIVRRPAG